jgi:hypothetical protein
MKVCSECCSPEECLRQGECEMKSLEMLDDYMQNHSFNFDEEE